MHGGHTLVALQRREIEIEIEQHRAYRQRYLPTQIANTRKKLRALENEARRYNMDHLLEVSSQ